MAKKKVFKKSPSRPFAQFEKRKQDHIKFALDDRTQVRDRSDLDFIRLQVSALPDLNFDEISTDIKTLGHNFSSPIFVSSMTAGHGNSLEINRDWARLSSEKNILCAVGSQRRELEDDTAHSEWKKIVKEFPRAKIAGNIGIAQLISSGSDAVLRLIDNLECAAFYVHLNALQEVLQPEGTPQFRGGWQALEELIRRSPVPILVKEVGCGLSVEDIGRLEHMGTYAVDLAGLGGTHWGRVEGFRSPEMSRLAQAAETFQNWGLSSAEGLLRARENHVNCQLWASGGIRSGLDIAKMVTLGAVMVGLAQPFMKAWMLGFKTRKTNSYNEVVQLYERLHYELKIALFCTASENLYALRGRYEVLKGLV